MRKRGASRRAPRQERRLILDIDGRAVPLRMVRHPRARRLILRLDPQHGGVTVTLPPWAGWAEGADMAVRERVWIGSRVSTFPVPHPFADGAIVPFLGKDHRIRHVGGRGVPVRRAEGELQVSGEPEHLPRRLTDWLKAQARAEIESLAHAKAAILGRRVARVTVRDTRSRWGSCSVSGRLSFCWRLVLAPRWILDYVVAHEVAHLRHHDHSPAFWATVARLTDRVDAAREWLRRNGPGLHLYG
jgi:predicted metal-dependent hydrolase